MIKRLEMSRVICVLLFAVLLTLQEPLRAFADIDPTTFSPRRGNSMFVIRNDNQSFITQGGDLTEAVNSTANGALIPVDADYMYMIKNEYNNNFERSKPYTERLQGSAASDSYIDQLSGHGVAVYPETKNADGTYRYPTNRSHFWWFKMSTESGNALSNFKKPKVKWSGLYIYDKESDTNQAIDLYMEVITHSMAGSFSNSVPALFSVSKSVNGLPSIRLYHIGAIQLRFTTKKAGTDEVYPLKTSITFGDVDGRQSVSSSRLNTSGFAAKSRANIQFGPYGTSPNRYWSATGNTDNDIDTATAESDNYKIAFYVNSGMTDDGHFDIVLTSSQKDNNRPSGNFARFYASTYENPDRSPVEIELKKPVKYVSGGEDRSHNTLSEMEDEITYTVVQKLPQFMYSGLPETDLSEFRFLDSLDSCLEYVPGSLKIYAVRDSAEIDNGLKEDPLSLESYTDHEITAKFDINYSGGRLSASWKAANPETDRDGILYSGEDGTVMKFVFRAKIKSTVSFDDLASHQGENGKAHRISDDSAEIPNRAEVIYRLRSENSSTTLRSVNEKYDESQSEQEKQRNSFVYTMVNDPGITVKFKKVDKETGGLLAGASLSIYEGEHPGTDSIDEEPLDIWTSGSEVYESPVKFKEGGKYTFVEDEAPPGYEAAGRIVFMVTGEDGQIITMEDEPVKADVTVTKNVIGSLGDTTKGFEFTLTLSGASPGRTYKVERIQTGVRSAVRGSENEIEFTADGSGNAVYEFALKDDEGIVVQDVRTTTPDGSPVTYTVTEKANNHRASYLTDTEKTGANGQSGKALTTDTLKIGEDRIVSFTNERDLAPPTDVKTDIRSYLALLAVVTALILIRLVRA